MSSLNILLMLGAGLMFISLLLGSLSLRIGVPSLLVFLVVGMVAGEDGLGLQFSDFNTGYLVSNIALAVILLDGGLRTRVSAFRVGVRPALPLATVGVALTAGLVGAFASWLLDVDWRLGLLLGAIVGSTDAAAVFSVIQGAGVRLNERVASTLEIESGMNDPMAIFLTVLLIQVLINPDSLSGPDHLVALVQQFGIGALVGGALGVLLAELLQRLRVNEGIYALLLCSGGIAIFGFTGAIGGSGFLAVYLAGMLVGNRRGGVGDSVLRSMDSLAWLAQSGMFLLLGLLVTPSELGDYGVQALLIAGFLMFVARPLAVWLCLLPFAFDWREKLFVSWTGLRGAVPIVLAMFPLLAGIEQTRLLFDITFVVVLTSLLVQGTSMGALARLLRLALPASSDPLQVTAFAGSQRYLMQFDVAEGARACGSKLASLSNEHYQPLMLIRNGQALSLEESLKVERGDRITWLADLSEKDTLADMCEAVTPSIKRYYGDFTVRGDVLVGDLMAIYGVGKVEDHLTTLTVAALFRRRVGSQPVVGDTLMLGGLRLRVRAVEGGRVSQVGIRLPH